MFSKKPALQIKLIKTDNFVLTFQNFDDLCKCSAFLKETYESSLYKWKDGYRMLVYFKKSPKLHIIKEFCTAVKTGSTEFSITEEYGEFICGGNAIEKINTAFNKTKAI